MAKMNNLLASFVIACASLAAAGPFFSEPEHGDMLRTSFDLSEARHDWKSERWWIECLFVDLDGDGVEEMAETLVYLKDKCLGQDRKVLVIGKDAEFKTVGQYLPAE